MDQHTQSRSGAGTAPATSRVRRRCSLRPSRPSAPARGERRDARRSDTTLRTPRGRQRPTCSVGLTRLIRWNQKSYGRNHQRRSQWREVRRCPRQALHVSSASSGDPFHHWALSPSLCRVSTAGQTSAISNGAMCDQTSIERRVIGFNRMFCRGLRIVTGGPQGGGCDVANRAPYVRYRRTASHGDMVIESGKHPCGRRLKP